MFWSVLGIPKCKETPKKMVVWLRPTYLSMGPFAGWLTFFPGKQRFHFLKTDLWYSRCFTTKVTVGKPEKEVFCFFLITRGFGGSLKALFCSELCVTPSVSHSPNRCAVTTPTLTNGVHHMDGRASITVGKWDGKGWQRRKTFEDQSLSWRLALILGSIWKIHQDDI